MLDRKKKKKAVTGDSKLLSSEIASSSSDEEFHGFDETACSSKLYGMEEVQILCYECDGVFPISALNMDKTTYYIVKSMADWGSRWHCSKCLSEKKCVKSVQVEKQLETMCSQIASIFAQMKTLASLKNKHEKNKIPDIHGAEAKSQEPVSTLECNSKNIAQQPT